MGLFYCTVCVAGSQPTPVLRKCCDPGHILNEWYECEAVDESQDIFLEEVSVRTKRMLLISLNVDDDSSSKEDLEISKISEHSSLYKGLSISVKALRFS